MRGIEQFLQVDAATLGALKYAGTWNASTNTPTLASGVGVQGQYYVVSVAGSTNLDGETAWQVGDWAVFNGTVWQKVDGGSTGLLTTLTVTGNTYLATTSGDVGIGTTSPAQKLDVQGATNPTIKVRNITPGVGNYSQLYLDTNNTFSGAGAAYLRAISENAGNSAVSLALGVNANGGGAPSEAMRITSAGDVGVGATSVTAIYGKTLQIGSGTSEATTSLVGSTGSVFLATVGATGQLIARGGMALVLGTNDAERMRITAAGDVGIGTSSPSVKLEVYDGTTGELRVTNATQGFQIYTQTGATTLGTYTNIPLVLRTNATEHMRIDTSGNVGIGTSLPGFKLDVVAAGTVTARVQNTTTSADACFQAQNTVATGLFGVNATGQYMYTAQSVPTLFYNAGSERMRIDTAGNLGLGVTPSAWGSDYRSIDNLLYNSSYSNNGGLAGMAFNAFNNGTNWVYKNTTFANRFESTLDSFRWYIAPSGTAGNAISFTQAMTLDTSGNLLVGTTANTESAKLNVQGGYIFLKETNGGDVYFRSAFGAGTDPAIQVASNDPLLFATNNAERARIPAEGGMVVGAAALATNATDGFLYVPTCAGTPTGTPTTQANTAPIVIDTTNNKLYFYSGGQWRDAGP